MIFETKEIQLRNGQKAILRSPQVSDATAMLEYLKTCSMETDFVLRYPEECTMSIEQEEKFLDNAIQSATHVMIACEVEGKIVGNCGLMLNNNLKTKHRASVAIAIVSDYWGLGIGTIMFNEMIELAKEKGIKQLELDYIEGNERAKALYQKVGFKEVGIRPDAIWLKDGTMLSEISMIKKL